MTTEFVPEKKEMNIIRPRSWLWLNIILMVFILLLAGAGVGFYFANVQQMSLSIAQLHTQTMKIEQASLVEQATLQQLQSTLQNQAVQLEQQQQSIRHLSLFEQQRQFQLDEIRYLVSLANTSLTFSRDAKTCYQLLLQAHEVILVMHDASLDILEHAIQNDMKMLAALTLQDASQVFLQIGALDQSIDEMPLLGSSFVEESDSPEYLSPPTVHTWKERLQKTLHQLKYVIDVRKTANSLSPLIAQKQGEYINQYLHMQLEQAQWAVLHNDNTIYQTSLAQANLWINRYYVILNPKTQEVLSALSALQAMNIRFPTVALDKTMTALQGILQ